MFSKIGITRVPEAATPAPGPPSGAIMSIFSIHQLYSVSCQSSIKPAIFLTLAFIFYVFRLFLLQFLDTVCPDRED
jgi:hypothetical protein